MLLHAAAPFSGPRNSQRVGVGKCDDVPVSHPTKLDSSRGLNVCDCRSSQTIQLVSVLYAHCFGGCMVGRTQTHR